MSAAGWIAALRLARRDALRNRGRSALTLALIGLPVLLLGVADIGYHTYQLTPQERLTRQIGAADAGYRWAGNRNTQQTPAGWLGDIGGSGAAMPHAPTDAKLAALLPPGTRVIQERVGQKPLTLSTRAGLDQAPLIGLDYRDPIAAGLVTQRSGRAPRTAHEVAVTTALARADGLNVGDVLHTRAPVRTYRIVGTVTDASNQHDRALYSLPSAVPRSAAAGVVNLDGNVDGIGLTWLVHTPHPVSWDTVRLANHAGLVVLSRSVYLHPDAAARAAAARLTVGYGSGDTAPVTVLLLIGGMALLEVVLLAGPAFAVGAKRRRRDLALVTASGGSARDVRRVVLLGGVVLGLAAGVGGALLAVVVGRLGLPLIRPHVARLPGAFAVHPLDLIVLAGVGLLAALLACAAPARAAARTDVVAALSGRPARAAIRARIPVLAAVLTVAGVLLAVAGATTGGNTAALAILAGTALVEIAVIVSTPLLLVLAARAGRRLPLTARMALRDAGRNRSAATPAVAAVMASVVGAVAILVGVASVADQQRREYVPALPNLAATVSVPATEAAARKVVRDLHATLPVRTGAVVDRPLTVCHRSSGRCSLTDLTVHGSPGTYSALPPLLVDNGSDTGALFGSRAGRARAALSAGRVVVTRHSLVHGGRVGLDSVHGLVRPNGYVGPGPVVRHHVRAVFVPTDGPGPLAVVPRTTAEDLGVRTVPYVALLRLTYAPTDAQRQAALARLHRVLPNPTLLVETGYRNQYGTLELALVLTAVAIAVLAAVIATGLANADARADLITLAAVGASPRIRRALSTARAGVIGTLGTVVGVTAGFLAPAAYVFGSPDGGAVPLRMSVPWTGVVAVAVGVPLLAAVVAASTTRARLPSE